MADRQAQRGETSRFGRVVLLIPLALGTLTWMTGIQIVRSGASSQDGVPVGMTLFMGSVMLLAAAGDVRMLLRGGVAGTKRISRHLWRMCFGLFIAAGSFFLGPAEIAFDSGRRKISTHGFIQHNLVFNSHPASADSADLLANPSALQKCIQRKVDGSGRLESRN
jgi:hypothetical protein